MDYNLSPNVLTKICFKKSETYPKVTSAYNIQTKEFFKTKTTTGCFHYSNVNRKIESKILLKSMKLISAKHTCI